MSLSRLRELWGRRGLTASELRERAESILRGEIVLPGQNRIDGKQAGTMKLPEARLCASGDY